MDKDIKKLIQLYDSLQHCYFCNEKRELNFENKPYINMLELLCSKFYKHELFCEEVLAYALESFIIDKNGIIEVNEKTISELYVYIENIFIANKEKHYLVFPLQGSGVKKDICFSNFYILKEKDEKTLLKQISRITNIDFCDVNKFIQHTQRSRSKDFLKSNIMIIELENQTSNIKRASYQMAESSINILKLIHSAFELESSIFRKSELHTEVNRHVAILSKDHWRCGHGNNWNANLQCKIDIDFMGDEKYQNIFCGLFETFFYKNNDSLNELFFNAFKLFGKANVQRTKFGDCEIALLLYLTALESLFTEGKNEKRLRIAAVVPRILFKDNEKITKLAETLEYLYRQRNNFLHAGEIFSYKHLDDHLEQLEETVSKIILIVLNMDEIISVNNNENRLNVWNKYTDNIFQNLILGKQFLV